MDKDGCRRKTSLEFLEGLLCPRTPDKGSPTLLGEGVDGFCDRTEARNEPLVEIGKPQEALNLLDGSRGIPVSHCHSLPWVHLKLGLSEEVTHERDLRHVELAFLGLDEQVVLDESLEDLSHMMAVFLQRTRKN